MELVVALAISGLVMLGARMLLERVAAEGQRISGATRAEDDRSNGERRLRELVLQLHVSVQPRVTFAGNDSVAQFVSWCRVAGGWMEQCDASIRIAVRGQSTALVVHAAGAQPVTVNEGEPPIALRYLASPASGGIWLRGWGESLAPPRAIGVIRQRDTLILRVGRAP